MSLNRRLFQKLAVGGLVARGVLQTPARASIAGWSFEMRAERLLIRLNGQAIATYVFRDKVVKRPYFMDVHTAAGTRLTRHYPPDAATEATDHPAMHPGLWLAFGRLNGQDYWRNRATVQHVRFLQEPVVEGPVLRFSVINGYLSPDKRRVICDETAEFQWRYGTDGVVLRWKSVITATSGGIELGHQEEMGLGVRLASPLRVKEGRGELVNSQGGRDEKGTWGKPAEWWAASMPAGGDGLEERAGVQVVARSSSGLSFWGHTRDYGLIVANPSPRPVEKKDLLLLKAGEPLKLEFTVRLFDHIKPRYGEWAREDR
jgi:hypothetical protein